MAKQGGILIPPFFLAPWNRDRLRSASRLWHTPKRKYRSWPHADALEQVEVAGVGAPRVNCRNDLYDL